MDLDHRAALVAVVAVGALAVVSTGGSGTDPDGNGLFESEDGQVAVDDGLTAQAEAILGGLPQGPIDGRESWRLPVVTDTPDGLAEGDVVTLFGRGFEPDELVGAVHCSSEADTASAGVGACDLGDGFANTVQGYARSDGTVVIDVPLRRHITTPELGAVDCASAAERCLLAIGAANDYDRSGGTYVSFAGAPPFPEPVVTIDPPGPYTAGQEVAVRATGLVPGRQYQVLQCVGEDHCVSLTMGRVGADGVYAATVAIGSAVDLDGDLRDCGDDCVLLVRGVGLPEQTTAPVPAAIPLGPIAGEQPVAPAPTTTTAPSPADAEPPTSVPSTVVEGTSPVPPSTVVPGTSAPTTVTPPSTDGSPNAITPGG